MAGDFFTCGVLPLGVWPEIQGQIGLMNTRVNHLLDQTLSTVQDLATYQIANVSFHVDPTAILDYALRTTDPDVDIDPVVFEDPGSIPSIGPVAISTPAITDDAPTAPADPPPVDLPPVPQAYHPVFPLNPDIHFPTIPTYGDLTSGIPFPNLREIVLPMPPIVDFNLPFTAQPPVFDATPPDPRDFNYTEAAYDPLLVTEIKGVLQSMYAGTTGLPRVVEDALFAREAEREAELAEQARDDAFNEMAARGFPLPTGVLNGKLAEIQQNTQNKKASLGRDVMIRVHEALLDQLKFGVQQGIALENMWATLFNEIQNRRLQAAQVAVNISIAVYNALVAQYQAAAQVYQIEAEVYKTRIEAELAKLQAYSEELKAQQLIGELNEQDVRIYTARLQAIETNIHLYVAQLQGYGEQITGEKLKLDVFHEEISTEQIKLAANQQELAVYNGQLQGQSLIQQAAGTRAQTYMTNVTAWKTKYEAQLDRQRGEIAVATAETQRYEALIQALLGKVQFQTAKGRAIVDNNTARLQRLQALVSADSAFNSAMGEKIRALNAANAANTEIALKNGEINAQNYLAVKETLEHAIATATQILAQMTSSFASSVNLNGSASDGTSFSQSCGYQTSQFVG